MIDINWSDYEGAIWRSFSQSWHPVKNIYAPHLDELINIEKQKTALLENTQNFIEGKKAHHVLLWGARGTGKSSLIKAIARHLTGKGLRVIQLEKKDLVILPDLTDQLRNSTYKFIVFLDDLSFSEVNDEYQSLKSGIEGNIEMPAPNVLYYVTSNKKHLISEKMQENWLGEVVDQTIRQGDNSEDKLALSDRFGLSLGFYSISQDEYFNIINQRLNVNIESDLELRRQAIQYSSQKGVRNARTAQQFCLTIMAK